MKLAKAALTDRQREKEAKPLVPQESRLFFLPTFSHSPFYPFASKWVAIHRLVPSSCTLPRSDPALKCGLRHATKQSSPSVNFKVGPTHHVTSCNNQTRSNDAAFDVVWSWERGGVGLNRLFLSNFELKFGVLHPSANL